MRDYNESEIPTSAWFTLMKQFKYIVTQEGFTSIGNYSFYKLSNLHTLLIPEIVTLVGFKSLSKSVIYMGPIEPNCEEESTSQFNVVV